MTKGRCTSDFHSFSSHIRNNLNRGAPNCYDKNSELRRGFYLHQLTAKAPPTAHLHPHSRITKMPTERKWWHTATIYELYPSSFKDSNNDGIGDIPGIISRIPYLASLGIDAVWLAACYKSSGVDMGYDVVDYQDIDPQYGTVQDVERLIAELGKHGIKLIMDLVVNHTSDEHAWFKESRSSLNNPKRDWYFWRKGRMIDGKRYPPNK